MASRNFRSNRIYNNHVFPVHIDARATIGSTGAITLVSSSVVPGSSPSINQQQSMGIKAITRLGVGTYQIQLDDNYSSMYKLDVSFTSAVTGAEIQVDTGTAGLSVGTAYQITTLGTSTAANWTTLGLASGLTAAVGQVFVALATGAGSGTGKVKAVAAANTSLQAQVLGVPDLMLNTQPFVQGNGGGIIVFQTLASIATPAAYTPAGTVSAPTFSGNALGTHTHTVTPTGTISAGNIAVAAGTAGDAVTNNAGVLNSTGGQDLTVDAQTFTGASDTTSATSAGTPAGTNSAPTFTGSAASLTTVMTCVAADPTNGVTMMIRLLMGNSSIS